MSNRPDDKAPFTSFPHHRLHAHAVALEALVKADSLAKRVPRGYAPLCDQLRRASQSAYLQTAEGAARTAQTVRHDFAGRELKRAKRRRPSKRWPAWGWCRERQRGK